MTDKIDLFKSLLDKEFWQTNHHRLDKKIFPEELHDLYEALEIAHETAKTGNAALSCRDLYTVYLTINPTLTASNKTIVVDLLKTVNESQELNKDIRDYVLGKALTELKAMNIAQAALDIAHGKNEDWDKLEALLRQDAVQEEIKLVTTDLTQISTEMQRGRARYNLVDLDRLLGPIGQGTLNILAGPVNAGKSALAISFVASPGGFLDQELNTLYIGNEESLRKTMLRCASAYTGLTTDEIRANPGKAQDIFKKVADRLKMIEDYAMSFNKLNHIIDKLRPDIVILDMIDKVGVHKSYQREDQRLGAIYEQGRETAKRYDCAVFGLSQTDAKSFGKLYYSFDRLHGSKVEKGANADTVITIGAQSGEFIPESDNRFRILNIAKSKNSGNGGKVNCQIKPEISRFVP